MIWRNLLRSLSCLALFAALPVGAAVAPAPSPTATALEHLLAGEFALQSGRFEDAADHYERALQAAPDPAVAERAARLALMAGDAARVDRALARWHRIDPASPDLAGMALQVHLMRGQTDAARTHARALLRSPAGWRPLLGILAQPQADGGKAARVVLRAVAEDPAFPVAIDAGLAYAGLARRLDDRELARKLADRLATANPDDPRILVAAATLDREAGQKVAARQRLDKALAQPVSVEVRRAAAGEYDALGDPAAGARVLAGGPQTDATYMLRAAWLVDAGDQAGLAALDRELQGAATSPARRLLLGQIAEVRADWAGAEAWYRQVDSGPERDRARLRIAAMLERQGRAPAGAEWLRGLQRDGGLDGDPLRDAYLHEAELWGRQNDAGRAMEAFGRGLAVFPDDAVLLYARAMQHVRRDRVDAGLADLQRILDRDGDHAEALNAYGYTLAEYKHRYAEALPYIEKSNRLQPGSAATLDSLGWIHHRLGATRRALPLLREAWARDEDPEIAAHLGELLWLTGEREEARKVWARGRELDADNRTLKDTVEKYAP